MADDLNAWTNSFYKRMREQQSPVSGPITTPSGTTLADLLTQSQLPKTAENPAVNLDIAPLESQPNWFERTIDIISRPLYTVGNIIDARVQNASGRGEYQDVLAEAGKGFTGKDKTLPSTVIKENADLPGWAEFTLGLGADIALDPLNLIPGAAIGAGARAVRGAVTGTSKTTRALAEAEKVATKAREAEEASALAAQKVREAEATGENLDQSVIDQTLADSKAAAEPIDTSAAGIQKLLDEITEEANKTGADRIREQIPGQHYLDPETIVPGAERLRHDVADPVTSAMASDLARVVTPDDMKAWRKKYKDRFTTAEMRGLNAARDPIKFKNMAASFSARTTEESATKVSDVLLNPAQYSPETVAGMTAAHGVGSLDEMAHKYRFTPDSMDMKAETIVSGPVMKENELIKARLARGGEEAADGVDNAAATQARIKAAQNDVAEAERTAQQTARQAEATQTRTTPPQTLGNEAQSKAVQKYVKEANKANADIKLKGPAAATAARETVVERLDKIAAYFRAKGDEPFLHVGPLDAATRRFEISTSDVIRTMAIESAEHAAIIDQSLFNASTGIGVEGFQQAAAEAIRQYDDWLMDPINARSGTWPPNHGDGIQSILDTMRNATSDDYMRTWTHPTGDAKRQGYYRRMLPEMQRNQESMAAALEQIAPKLADIVATNRKARQVTDAADSGAIADAVTTGITVQVANGSATGIKAIAESVEDIKKASTTVGASPKASYEAAAKIATQIREKYGVTQDQVRRLRQNAEARAARGPQAQSQINRINREQARADIREADEVGRAVLGPEYTHDVSQQINAATTNMFMKTLNALGRSFSFGFKSGELAVLLKEGRSASYTIGKRFEKLLTGILKSSTKEQQVEAMRLIRMNHKPAAGTPERALYDNLREAIDLTYDTSSFDSTAGIFTNWFAQGIPVGEMNKALAAVKLPHRFKEVEKGHWSEIPDQWKTWEIDDPIDFAHKSFEAIQRVAANKSAATYAAAKWGVKKPPGPGWVKLTDESGDSAFLPYMDKDLYYPKELAVQISNLDRLMKQSVSFTGKNGVHRFVREVVDPYMQLWKPLITIAKRGHHLRNITGDFFITALDMQFRKIGPAYAKAGRIMHGNKAFDGARAITQTGQLTEKIGPNVGKERLGVRLRGGKKVMLDDANTYKLAFQRGLLPEFTKSEDLIRSEGTGLLSKAAEKLSTSAPMKKVGAFAEYSSHVGRMAHFIALMEKPSFTRRFGSIEDASRAAAERVKKFHPDTSGLTPFEQKYMRRIFPFYTWFRQTSPVVMGNLFTHPGRIMAVPKIQYGIAESMGVNPNSLGDPFPDGQMYPSWIRDSMTGPIGPGGTMMNMGSAQEGILPDFLSANPLRSVANMTTPFVKQPYEAITGTKVQTGTPLTDMSEFWDQILPGGSALGQLTSTSPLGTLGNLATGEGLDPSRSVQQGDQTRFFNRSLANFFTGLGLTNSQTPTVRNSAFKEATLGTSRTGY